MTPDCFKSSWFSLNIYIFCECININTTLNFFMININHCTRSVLNSNCFWYRFFFLSHIIRLEQEFIKFYSRHFTYRQSLKTHAEGPKWKREEGTWSNVKCLQTLCNCRVDANVYCSKTLRFKGNQTSKLRKIISNEIPFHSIETLISGVYPWHVLSKSIFVTQLYVRFMKLWYHKELEVSQTQWYGHSVQKPRITKINNLQIERLENQNFYIFNSI